MMQTFQGAWPALVTPFTAENEVDVAALDALVDYLLGRQVDGFYVCGSTGQGIYMSAPERKVVAQTVLARVAERVPVIVHVGSQVLGDAMELAVHAQEAGAAGISSIIPAGYSDFAGISRYYAAVAGAVPDLPFLPYLFTSSLDAVELMEAIRDIPDLAGAKYTGPNMYEFKRVVGSRDGSWSVFSGMDEQCVFAAMFDSCGNIGSTLNVIPGIYRHIHHCCHVGDLIGARDLQIRANRVTETLLGFGFFGALYSALELLGLDVGAPRLPALPLPVDKRDELRNELAAVDFFAIAEM